MFDNVKTASARILHKTRRFGYWSLNNVPWGVRSVLGLLFVVGGIFSILPVLGLWMLPVGIVLMSLDIPPWRNQLLRWLKDKEREVDPADKT